MGLFDRQPDHGPRSNAENEQDRVSRAANVEGDRVDRAEDVEQDRVVRAEHVEGKRLSRAHDVALLARRRALRATMIAVVGAIVSIGAMSYTIFLAVEVAKNAVRTQQNVERIECLSNTSRTEPERCPPVK